MHSVSSGASQSVGGEELFDSFLEQNSGVAQARVLVIEDDHTQQIHVKRLLTDMGHNVICASNGAEAITKVQTCVFDVILMDIYLPDINGLDLCQMLRRAIPNGAEPAAVIAMSCSDDVETIRACFLTNCCRDYVVKPLRGIEMRLRIENALIERQLHRTEAARVKALHNCVDSVAEHANTMASVTSHLGNAANPVSTLTLALRKLENTMQGVTGEQRKILDELHLAKDAVTILAARAEMIISSMQAVRSNSGLQTESGAGSMDVTMGDC